MDDSAASDYTQGNLVLGIIAGRVLNATNFIVAERRIKNGRLSDVEMLLQMFLRAQFAPTYCNSEIEEGNKNAVCTYICMHMIQNEQALSDIVLNYVLGLPITLPYAKDREPYDVLSKINLKCAPFEHLWSGDGRKTTDDCLRWASYMANPACVLSVNNKIFTYGKKNQVKRLAEPFTIATFGLLQLLAKPNMVSIDPSMDDAHNFFDNMHPVSSLAPLNIDTTENVAFTVEKHSDDRRCDVKCTEKFSDLPDDDLAIFEKDDNFYGLIKSYSWKRVDNWPNNEPIQNIRWAFTARDDKIYLALNVHSESTYKLFSIMEPDLTRDVFKMESIVSREKLMEHPVVICHPGYPIYATIGDCKSCVKDNRSYDQKKIEEHLMQSFAELNGVIKYVLTDPERFEQDAVLSAWNLTFDNVYEIIVDLFKQECDDPDAPVAGLACARNPSLAQPPSAAPTDVAALAAAAAPTDVAALAAPAAPTEVTDLAKLNHVTSTDIAQLLAKLRSVHFDTLE